MYATHVVNTKDDLLKDQIPRLIKSCQYTFSTWMSLTIELSPLDTRTKTKAL